MTTSGIRPPSPGSEMAELHSGDRMSAEEFHRIYQRMPEDFKAELIGGIVYVSSPGKRPHATCHSALSTLFFLYAGRAPGLETGDNGTIRLGEDSAPQPDLYLRILPEFGGQSKTTEDDYVAGPPELVAEIAHSTRSIDFHAKRKDYATYGVLEYLVVSLQPPFSSSVPARRRNQAVKFFDLKAGKEIAADESGFLRSSVFPGLWIDPDALFAKDASRLIASLERGLAAPEHEAFKSKLGAKGKAH